MRQLTEEQKAKTEERRAKFRVIMKQIAGMSETERTELASRISTVTVEGRQLSVHNMCLLASQCPTATIVGGFNQWKKFVFRNTTTRRFLTEIPTTNQSTVQSMKRSKMSHCDCSTVDT